MKPVNLLPEESRGRGVATGDPRLSYGIIGGLGLLLLMVLFTISQSNKATTLTDEAAELRAEAAKYQSQAAPVTQYTDFGNEVDKRKLLIGGLAESRFPWHTALFNLSQAVPLDVTIDSLTGTAATAGDSATAAAPAQPGAPAEEKPGATIEITGCSRGWVSYAQFASRLKTMPGVLSVSVKNGGDSDSSGSNSPPQGDSGAGGGPDDGARKKNCGKNPLNFSVGIEYRQIPIDLIGLPKVASAAAGGASSATGATGATGAATASATGAG